MHYNSLNPLILALYFVINYAVNHLKMEVSVVEMNYSEV